MIEKKTKILFLIDDLKIGGAEKLLIETINNLDGSKYTVILVTLSNKGELFNKLPYNIEKKYCTKNPIKLYKILKNEKPDIFHSHLWKSDFIGLILAKLAKIKKIYSTKHNVNYFRGIKKILIPIDAVISSLACKVISISDSVKKFYENNFLYKKTKFQTIYNGIDLNPFLNIAKNRESKTKFQKPFYILTIASLTKQKGHEYFLNILYEVKDYNFEWHLVGSGNRVNKIKVKADKLGILNKIFFHGEQINVMEFYEKADLFVLPSLWEGFGLVLIEAASANVPIFASNVDGINEILNILKAGIPFSIKNQKESSNKLKSIMSNDANNSIKYENINEFSIDKMIKQLSCLYENI